MDLYYLLLFGLGVLSGFSVTCLGMGGGVYIVPLIPLLIGTSPYETMQLSFCIIFCFTLFNSVLFIKGKRIDWSFAKTTISSSLLFAFISNLFVLNLSPYQVRFTLWLFLGVVATLPIILRKSVWIVKKLPVVSGMIVGLCTGLTGIGGGALLSPALHESKLVSTQKIPGTICVIMFPIACIGLLAQVVGTDFPRNLPAIWWHGFFTLMSASVIGAIIGYNVKFKTRRAPRYIVRVLVFLIFCKVTGELITGF